MLSGLKERAYEILSIKDPDDSATRPVNGFHIMLLPVNVAAFFTQNFEDIARKMKGGETRCDENMSRALMPTYDGDRGKETCVDTRDIRKRHNTGCE